MKASPSDGRLIIDPPLNGAWNMAVDQVLLESAENEGRISLRFYEWAEPTLSLGYFQSHQDRQSHGPSRLCSLIRRSSGGGAIVHHHELTYSLCLPSENRWSQRNSDLYALIHRIMIQQFNNAGTKHGVPAMLYSDFVAKSESNSPDDSRIDSPSETAPVAVPQAPTGKHSFLCFLRRSDGDVVIDSSKVVGSAQRRLRKSLIQHGSILLQRSEFAPELLGINDLRLEKLTPSEIVSNSVQAISEQLGIQFARHGESHLALTPDETASAKKIQSDKFGCRRWSERR